MKNPSVIEVLHEGRLAGRLAEFEGGTIWEYEADFVEAGENLSPWTLEFTTAPQSKSDRRYFGLPGMVADALPDCFGMRIMEDYFQRKNLGRPGPLARLAYVGDQGIGALSFRPALPDTGRFSPVDLGELEGLSRTYFEKKLSPELAELMRRTGTAGGARPKALVTTAPGEKKVLPGYQGGAGNEYWLVKFQSDPQDEETVVEHAFSLLAGKCGIRVVETKLWEVASREGPLRHLGVRRFDCGEKGRIHYLSFSGLMEGDFAGRSTPDYAVFLLAAGRLCGDYGEKREALRRCLFNVLVSNLDDHAKNHGFLFQDGEWKLSPAFDLTHGIGDGGQAMSVAGRNTEIGEEDFSRLLLQGDVEKKDYREDLEQVREGLRSWKKIAQSVALSAARTKEIQRGIEKNLERFI